MRVTVVSDARVVWGSEQSILNLAPHLAARGVALTLACPPGDFARAGGELGLPHAPLALPPRGGERRHPLRELVRDARGIPAGARRIAYATRGADVVHSNNLLMHPDAALAGRRTRTATVLELHDIVAPGAPSAALSASVALSNGAIAISTAVAATVHGPGRRRVHLVPQAVDTERFSPGPAVVGVRAELGGCPNGPTDGEMLVGILGRIDPSKGVLRLVTAAAAVPGVRLAVIGASSIDSGAYAEQVRTLGNRLLGGRFHWLGQREDTVDLLRSIDVLVNASTDEPFGLSVLEAMSCGTAVVAGLRGGPRDFVEDGRTGLLVDTADPHALAAALRALQEHELRARLGTAARAAALARHSIEARADAVFRVYRTAFAARSRGTGRPTGHRRDAGAPIVKVR